MPKVDNLPEKKKKTYPEFKKDPYVQKWIVNFSEKQQSKRLGVFKRFTKFIEKTPKQLILEHAQDLSNLRNGKPLEITHIAKHQILAFYDYLIGNENKINNKAIKKPVHEGTAYQYAFSVIASFYSYNDVPVKFQRKEKPAKADSKKAKIILYKGKMISLKDRLDLLKKVRDALPSIRDKAILLAVFSSGLNDADLREFTIADYNKYFFQEFNISHIRECRKKSKVKYRTAFSSEACEMINLYLEKRKDDNEQITDDSYLFANLREQGSQMKHNAFSVNLKSVCDSLDIDGLTPTTLRREFGRIASKKVERELVEIMMGHVENVPKKYIDVLENPDDFIKMYAEKLNDDFCLGNGSQEIREQKAKLSELERENKDLKADILDIQKELKHVSEMAKFWSEWSQEYNSNGLAEEIRARDERISQLEEKVKEIEKIKKSLRSLNISTKGL